MQKIVLKVFSALLLVVFYSMFNYENKKIKNQKSNKREIASIKNKKKIFSQSDFEKYLSKKALRTFSYEGVLQGEVVEEFGQKHKHKINYYLIDENGRKTNFENIGEVPQDFISKKVKLKAFEENKKLMGIVYTDIGDKHDVEKPLPFIQREKTALFFIRFNNSQETFITMEEAKKHADTAYKDFFYKLSDGKIRQSTDVFGWYDLKRNGADSNDGCLLTKEETRRMVQKYNIDITKYTNITMISNCAEYGTIGGRASLNRNNFFGFGHKLSYIKMAAKPSRLAINDDHSFVPGWTSFTSILIHERGHNFGLPHSNALDCGSNKYLQDCHHIEYGNRFDRMGGPDASYTFNADQQRMAGWKNETDDFLHIKTSGTYKLDRLTEYKYKGRKIGAYIYHPVTGKKAFMLEYRMPHEYDANLANPIFEKARNGLHLYSSTNPSTNTESPTVGNSFRYIDSNPTVLDWSLDTAYESLKGSYFDPATGITIKYKRRFGNSKVEFLVEYNEDKRVCYKKTLDDKVSRAYIRRYFPLSSKPNSYSRKSLQIRNKEDIKTTRVILAPGDDFRIQFDSFLADHIMCPRDKFRLKIKNYKLIRAWVKNQKVGSGSSGSGSLGSGSGSGKSRRLGDILFGDLNIPKDYYDYDFENYNKTESMQEMRVPQSAVNKNYPINFSLINRETGKVIKDYTITLYIRENRKKVFKIKDNNFSNY